MDQYFALAPTDEIANEVKNKFEEHLRWLDDSGQSARIQLLYDKFYNFDRIDMMLSEDESTAYMSVPHFRNLVERIQTLICQARLNFTPKAANSDSTSQLEADFAKGLLEYYNEFEGMNGVTSHAVLMALVMYRAFIFGPWDWTKGSDQATGFRSGDQAFHNLSLYEVAIHPDLQETPYFIVKLRQNKWDLAALFPDKADEITKLSAEDWGRVRLQTPFKRNRQPAKDEVDVYYFFHERTLSMPKGREAVIVGTECLMDSALRYKTIPVASLNASKILCAGGSESPASALLGIQTVSDKLWSAVTTNNLANARQNVWAPTAIEQQALSHGATQLISPQKPEAVQLTQSAPETYKLIDSLQNQAETLSGINAVVRGNPSASVSTSGGQALMLAQAIEYVSPLQAAYAQMVGDLGTIFIHNMQIFCTEEKLAYIGGQSRKSYAKMFKKDAISSVNHVIVDLGSPMAQTVTGRYSLVQEWTKMGMIKRPQDVEEFLRSGQIDSLTEDDFHDAMLIRNENEEIRKGQDPIVSLYDLHDVHFQKHKELASDPAFRYNPQLMAVLNNHLQDHIEAKKNTPPDIVAMVTGQPFPPPPPPPGGNGPQPPQMKPQVQGEPLPDTPNGAPPMAAAAYDQATQPFMA